MPYFAWNGHRLFYRERGKGPLLLVFPGNTASSVNHKGELDHFSRSNRVAALDFLGTGQSDRVAVWALRWWEQNARQAQALVAHLGYTECIAMGTSGGGVVALLMAILYPDKVRAVIADSCGERFTPQMLAQNVIADRARRTPEQAAFWGQAHGTDWEQVVDADTDMIRRFVAPADAGGCGGDWFEGRLSQIRCPVLLTASRQDDMLPNICRQLCSIVEQISDCRAYMNNKGAHPLMWSCSRDFRAISDHFLAEIKN
jgi:pimeloyl-ACP methyl ester carboxylesterase